MSDKEKLIQLMVDTHKKVLPTSFSERKALDEIRNELVGMNGGRTTIGYKDLRGDKGREVFEIIESVVSGLIIEGIENDVFFQTFVEYRNKKLLDSDTFYVADDSILTVSEISEGTQNIKRQRINVGETVTVRTSLKAIKIFAELNQILAGRIDFNEMINRIYNSFERRIAQEVYTGFQTTFGSLPAEFAVAGAWDEEDALEMAMLIESLTGRQVMIAGTKLALRNIATAVVSEKAREEYNSTGYYGTFNGIPLMEIKQIVTPGTYNFGITNNDLYFIPGDIKPVKMVDEGEGIIISGDPMSNQDLSQEFFYASRWGIGVMIAIMFGIYRLP